MEAAGPSPVERAFSVFEPTRSLLDWRLSGFDGRAIISLVVLFFRLRLRQPQAAFLLAMTILALLPVLLHFWHKRECLRRNALPLHPVCGVLWSFGLALQTGAERLKRFGAQLSWAAVGIVTIFYIGLTVHRNKDWRDNITLFSHAIANSPNSSEIHNTLAREYLDRGDFEAARVQYQQALLVREKSFDSSDFNFYTSLLGMGAIESHAGRVQESARWVSQALALLPDHPEAYTEFGRVLMQQGQVDKGIEYFQRAVELDPNDERFHFNLGLAFQQTGQDAKALEQVERSVQIYPGDPQTWRLLGIVPAALKEI